MHRDLALLVKMTIKNSPIDFGVHDGIREVEEQHDLVRRGVSKTMKSRHLTGHAVDLVPYINGKLRWEWKAIYELMEAVRQNSRDQRIPIRWGGVWDRRLDNLGRPLEEEVKAYAARRRKKGYKVFLDGPHIELPRRLYPDDSF